MVEDEEYKILIEEIEIYCGKDKKNGTADKTSSSVSGKTIDKNSSQISTESALLQVKPQF